MGAIEDFVLIVEQHGSDVVFHRDDSFVPCPCRTPEGFRDPIWHVLNPTEPVCNAAGMLPAGPGGDISMKAFVQPVQAGAVRRLTTEQIIQVFGEIQADDHIGFFACTWAGEEINFYDWGLAGEDWVQYNGRRYVAVSANLIPDPETGSPFHHWEVGLRLIGTTA